VDLILKGGLTTAGAANGVAALIAIVLAFSRDRSLHALLAGVMWFVFVGTWVVRSMG